MKKKLEESQKIAQAQTTVKEQAEQKKMEKELEKEQVEHGVASKQNTKQNTQQTSKQNTNSQQQAIQQQPVEESGVFSSVKNVGLGILYFIIIFIGVAVLVRLLKWAFRYGYAFFNARRLIFLKVLLPRGDSKVDREQEKEVARDMKEKI